MGQLVMKVGFESVELSFAEMDAMELDQVEVVIMLILLINSLLDVSW